MCIYPKILVVCNNISLAHELLRHVESVLCIRRRCHLTLLVSRNLICKLIYLIIKILEIRTVSLVLLADLVIYILDRRCSAATVNDKQHIPLLNLLALLDVE